MQVNRHTLGASFYSPDMFATGNAFGDPFLNPQPGLFDESIFAGAADATAPGIVDIARQLQAAGESLIDAISRARMTVAMSDAQRELLQIQIDRARQGLPPIQTAPYTTTGGAGFIDGKVLLVLLLVGLVLATRRG